MDEQIKNQENERANQAQELADFGELGLEFLPKELGDGDEVAKELNDGDEVAKDGLAKNEQDREADRQEKILHQKAFIRKKIKERLAKIEPHIWERYNNNIYVKVNAMYQVQKAESIFIYNSFGYEPDTSAIIASFLKKGKKVYVPVTTSSTVMEAVLVDENTKYVKNEYGIREPVVDLKNAEQEKQEQKFDVVIMPLMAYDNNRNRLGRGKGYYDRFLKKESAKDAFKIGLAFSTQRIAKVIAESHDERADIIITEQGIV